MQELQFGGKSVLQHMAKRNDMKVVDLSAIFDGYIAERLISDSKKYWERIKKKGEVPAATELLDFIYDKFDVNIEGGVYKIKMKEENINNRDLHYLNSLFVCQLQ